MKYKLECKCGWKSTIQDPFLNEKAVLRIAKMHTTNACVGDDPEVTVTTIGSKKEPVIIKLQ